MRLDELLHELDLGWVADTQQDDRDIAGDAILPKPTLAAPVLQQHARGSALGGIGVNQSAGQPRINLSLGFGRAELAQGHIGPSEIKGNGR